MDFERLLVKIFGDDFIEAFKRKRPAGWVDLLLAFESRKRAATPFKSKPLNVSLPFSFTDYHQKYRVSSQDSSEISLYLFIDLFNNFGVHIFNKSKRAGGHLHCSTVTEHK